MLDVCQYLVESDAFVELDDDTRVCRKCDIELFIELNWREKAADKYDYICRPCEAKKGAICKSRWRSANPDRNRQIEQRRQRKRRRSGKKQAQAAKDRARLEQALPCWFNDDEHAACEAIYAEARRLTYKTSIPHHVDHIVPIRGDGVCGLHWSHNLRVVPATQNLTKGNSFDPDTYVHKLPRPNSDGFNLKEGQRW